MNQKTEDTGYLALLLHAHLPYVHSCQEQITFEEKWLFEALTESYLPMIMSWEELVNEKVDFRLNLSVSPPLISMLTDVDLKERYCNYLEKLIELTLREKDRTANDPTFLPLAEFYHQRLSNIYHAFKDKYQYDLLKPLKRLQDQGVLELLTTGATHGFMPLMITDEARRAQIKIAVELFGEVFGKPPKGLWLPECAYIPGVEKILKSEGINYTIIATHGILNAVPKVPSAVYAPVKIGSEVAAFGRDWETSQQVWSRTEGYPGDVVYREFYRDIGYDMEQNYIEPYLIGEFGEIPA